MPAFGHMPGNSLRDMKNTARVGRQNILKGFWIKFHQAGTMLDTGIINDNINRAIPGFVIINRSGDILVICNIENQFPGLIAFFCQRLYRFFRFIFCPAI